MPLFRRDAPLAMLGLLAACSSPPPVLYTLLPVPGTPRPGGPRAVSLREVSLARYLDRQQIVRSANEARLNVASNDWWGEPLDAMMTRVLVENLAQRLPSSSIIATGGAISVPADAIVEVNLQRLGLTGPATLSLTAQVAIAPRDATRRPTARLENISVPVDGTGTEAFVTAASTALGQLANAISAALAP